MSIDNKEFDPEFLDSLSYPTPFFLFSKNKLRHNLKKFRECFPKAMINYAIKANSEQELLQTLFDDGVMFEVASVYELDMLKSIGVGPEKIVYGSSIKPAHHIKEFFDYGVRVFAFDSPGELEKIASNAPNSKVYVRAVVNDTGSVFKFSEKFGAEKESLIPLLHKAKELSLHPYGISFHVGSQANNVMAWANALEHLNPVIEKLMEDGIELEIINLGGGYPCKYNSDEIPALEEIAEHALKEYKKFSYQPKIMVEPGRAIVADSGIAVASVIARVERKGNSWLFLDLGVYNGLFEAMAYQGSTRYPITSMRKVGDGGETLFALAGPTGDGPDIITREALLPSDTDVGDKLIIHNVGAYSLVVSSPFNGFPKPSVYYI